MWPVWPEAGPGGMFLREGDILVTGPLQGNLLTEVGHPGGSSSQGDEDLLVGQVEWHRQLT